MPKETKLRAPDFPPADSGWDANVRSQRLRDAMRAAGGNLTVSKAADVPLSTIQGYLNGKPMKLDTAIALARACGITVEWLATGHGEVHPGKDGQPANPPADLLPMPINDTDKSTPYKKQAIDVQHLAASLKIRFELTPPAKPMTWREFALGVAFFYEVSTPTPGDPALADEFVPFCAQPNDVGQP